MSLKNAQKDKVELWFTKGRDARDCTDVITYSSVDDKDGSKGGVYRVVQRLIELLIGDSRKARATVSQVELPDAHIRLERDREDHGPLNGDCYYHVHYMAFNRPKDASPVITGVALCVPGLLHQGLWQPHGSSMSPARTIWVKFTEGISQPKEAANDQGADQGNL